MTRTLLNSFVVFFLAAILFSCSGGDSPKAVAEKFLKEMNSFDFEGAKQYGTEDTERLLEMMSGFSQMVPDSSRKPAGFEITGEKIEGDKATVTYREEGKDGEIPLSLVKVDGKWKVAMSKETLNGSEEVDMNIGATNTDTSGPPSE